MTQALWTFAGLAVAACLAALATAWWGRGRYVRGRLAVLAAAAFLAVGLVGGLALRGPLGSGIRQHRANDRAEDLFRTGGLLRALAQAEPEHAERLRTRLVNALAAVQDDAQSAAVEQRIQDEATSLALSAGLSRLANATDDAAARLAEALLAALKDMAAADASLCVGLLTPEERGPAQMAALGGLRGEARKKLDAALALVLASSSMKPQVAPNPLHADAALAEMFGENLPAFQETYGNQKQVMALFEALGDPAQAGKVAPQTLCAFAQDLLRALLRMPPAERGPGLRRLLGA